MIEISGLVAGYDGLDILRGADLTNQPPEAVLRAGVAQVPQRNGLFTRLTVRQNVLMGAYVIRRRRKHLEARYDELAQTFAVLAARPGVLAGMLSGGQRRMVEFARALMLEPDAHADQHGAAPARTAAAADLPRPRIAVSSRW
jgi:branched-chain amino acid transport system ATP-binding protein